MERYADVDVVVDGALERTETAYGLADVQECLDRARREHAADPEHTTAVYVLWHEHAEGIDCECVQYATDHNPMWSSERHGHTHECRDCKGSIECFDPCTWKGANDGCDCDVIDAQGNDTSIPSGDNGMTLDKVFDSDDLSYGMP